MTDRFWAHAFSREGTSSSLTRVPRATTRYLSMLPKPKEEKTPESLAGIARISLIPVSYTRYGFITNPLFATGCREAGCRIAWRTNLISEVVCTHLTPTFKEDEPRNLIF